MRYYPQGLIAAKREGKELTSEQVEWLVNAYLKAEVTDAQMAAFLMAVCCRGMTPPETIALTGAMIDSGKSLRLSDDFPHSADKHSTGGVGDKTTLEVLEGRGPRDVALLSLRLAAEMLLGCGLFGTAGEALRAAETALDEGRARDAFTDIVVAQGGRLAESVAADECHSVSGLTCLDVKSPKDGYLRFVDVDRR